MPISSITAQPTAVANALPLKVPPWSPCSKQHTSSCATSAPSGMPPPSPLASIMMSGVDARMLEAEEFAGAADPGLDLVEDQQDAVARCVSARRPRRNSSVATNTPASPWIGSSITATVFGVIARSTAARSLSAHLGKSRHLRLEQLLPLRLAGGRHRGERAAVEAVIHGDDLVGAAAMLLAPFARELDRALDRLGARIGEEGLVQPALLARSGRRGGSSAPL